MRIITKYFLIVVFLYNTFAIVFTAGDSGTAHDEWYYRWVGKIYWNTHKFFENQEHPPVAKLLGAALPVLLKKDNSIYYRLPHLLLFLMAGIWVTLYFYFKKNYFTSMIFSLLYFFNPSFKAFASLNVTDFVVSLLLALSAFIMYINFNFTYVFFSSFVLGLALNTKFSALFYLPFFAIAFFYNSYYRGRRIDLKQMLYNAFISLLAIALAFIICYHFQFSELINYWQGIVYQFKHNTSGHLTYLFGELSRGGFWYYYLMLFIFKTPIIMLLIFIILLAFINRLSFVLFYLPALGFLFILSKMDIQSGYRYALPFIMFLVFGSAVSAVSAVSTIDKNKNKNINIKQNKIIIAIIVLFIIAVISIEDVYTLNTSSYMSYFNQFAPTPTRNFADSNIDWGQDIPKHLMERDLDLQKSKRLEENWSNYFLSKANEFIIRIGASELTMVWGNPLARFFKQLTPIKIVAGYEIFKVNKAQLFDFLLNHNHPYYETPIINFKNKKLENNFIIQDADLNFIHSFDSEFYVSKSDANKDRSILLIEFAPLLEEEMSNWMLFLDNKRIYQKNDLYQHLEFGNMIKSVWKQLTPGKHKISLFIDKIKTQKKKLKFKIFYIRNDSAKLIITT
ncbi:MAG: hypothetical protein HQK51_08895 [Oligoflexia bacterium]|nr:hypothetical protein [Oligoflexia bacterium]